MSQLLPKKLFIFLPFVLAVVLVGCSHQKTNRGHLFRGDWAFEYNRTPWIGCPPDTGCVDESESKCGGLLACLKKDEDEKKKKGVRRHCGMRRGCTPFNPCCQVLGCGMWVDPGDSTIPVSTMPTVFGTTTSACGLTPFCCPQKPCGITPDCGKPVSITPQTIANLQASNGLGGMATIRGMSPTGTMLNGTMATGTMLNGTMANGAMLNGTMANGAMFNGTMANRAMLNGTTANGAMLNGTMANGAMFNGTSGTVPGTLVSRGIVPGASAITSGGMVAAIGVATPAGTMTPVGVRMPNGLVSNNVVLRACVMTPNCTAAHPCGLTPNCGGAVAVNMVANNAIALASALQAQGVSGGVMQAGGMGMLVNPVTNQPINGVTMGGYTQAGYPPIGYAPTGYAPGYPRYAAGIMGDGEAEKEEETMEQAALPETRSVMPVPRFHPVPTKPPFQRSEGMPPTPQSQRTVVKPTTTAMIDQHGVSERELEAALDQAYLEGVSAAMDEVERKLEAKRQIAAKVKLQEKILQQSDSVQQQLDEQEQLQIQAMQRARREQQIRQQSAKQPDMLATAEMMSEPKRLPAPKPAASVAKTGGNANEYPTTLSGSLKNSNATGMLVSLFESLGSNQPKQTNQKGQVLAKPRVQNVATPRSGKAVEVVSALDLPKKPPVSSMSLEYGLLPEEKASGPLILQTQYTTDSVAIRP